jgi:hypothetical protein
MKTRNMITKTVGMYAIVISIFGICILLYTLFVWDRFVMMLSLSLGSVGIVVSLFGLIIDKNKIPSLIAIALCLIPYLYLVLIAE